MDMSFRISHEITFVKIFAVSTLFNRAGNIRKRCTGAAFVRHDPTGCDAAISYDDAVGYYNKRNSSARYERSSFRCCARAARCSTETGEQRCASATTDRRK